MSLHLTNKLLTNQESNKNIALQTSSASDITSWPFAALSYNPSNTFAFSKMQFGIGSISIWLFKTFVELNIFRKINVATDEFK